MKIRIEVDLTTHQGQALIEYLYKQTCVEGPAGLQVSEVGDDNPTVTIHGPSGAVEVSADDAADKYADLQNQTLAEAMNRKPEAKQEKQPEKVAPAKATQDIPTTTVKDTQPTDDVAEASKRIRDLIIDASTLPGVEVADAMSVVHKFGVKSTKDLTAEQAPAVIAALEGFLTSKKAENGEEAPTA